MNAMQLRRGLALAVAPAAVVLSACNPLTITPTQLEPNIYGAPAYYAGPPEGWVEATTEGTWGYDVALVALVQHEQMAGPADRWCATPGAGIAACEISGVGVFTEPFIVNGDPAVQGWTRLITVYPDDGVEVLIQCRNQFTGALGCPTGTTVTMRTVTDGGDLVGDLEEAAYEGAGGSGAAAEIDALARAF